MLHAQISTAVLILSLLCLLPSRHSAAVFSKMLFLLLCCTYIVVFANDCSQQEKWKWFVVKVVVLLANMIVHRKSIDYSLYNYAFGLGVLLLYLSLVDIQKIYACTVQATQFVYTFAFASSSYFLFMLSQC